MSKQDHRSKSSFMGCAWARNFATLLSAMAHTYPGKNRYGIRMHYDDGPVQPEHPHGLGAPNFFMNIPLIAQIALKSIILSVNFESLS